MADYTDDHPPRDERTDDTNHPRVARLSDLDDFEVADGYPDVRGWDVIAADGTRVGKVKDLVVDTGAMRTRYLEVELNEELRSDRAGGEGRVLVPIGSAQLRDDGDDVLLIGFSADQVASLQAYDDRLIAADRARFQSNDFDDRRFFGAHGRTATNADETRVPLAEEELDVQKRRVQAGEVNVHKRVETEHVTQPVTLRREEVTIQRRPVTRADAGQAEISDDEVRIPLRAEEAVVEKRPVVKEELVIRKHMVADEKEVDADLRRERIDVDRKRDAKDRDPGGPANP